MGRVAVVGSINIDYVMTIDHLPRPGETVAGGALAIHPGGKGANQAHAAARLGADVAMIGAIGTDAGGEQEHAALRRAGVDTSSLRTVSGSSGVAVILVDGQGENMIAVAAGANGSLGSDEVEVGLAARLSPGSVVLTSLEIPAGAVAATADSARRAAAALVINPAPARPLAREVVAGSILTPNEGEIRLLVPAAESEEACVAALLEAGARAVVVTRGGHGASLYQPGQPEYRVPAPRVPVVDTVGAGDAFNGALGAALSDGESLRAGVRMAVAAGAAACTGAGARGALPTRAEVALLMADVAGYEAGAGPAAGH